MEDKELLELAAKAAAIQYIKPTDDYDGAHGLVLCDEHNRPGRDWNPLADDGDALRLAVTLELGVVCKRHSDPYEKNRSIVTDPYRVNQLRIVEAHKGDPAAATRRAVVRAAAEIGRTK